jgi:CBS domain-containing protein
MTRRDFTVEDMMSTALVTARPNDTVADVDFEMRLAGIRHIPIVDHRNRLIGIVSDRDILRALARAKGGSVSMRTVMTTGVVTVKTTTPADEAADEMLANKIGGLPVLDDDDQLVGVVTESDFVRLARDFLLEPRLRTARSGG